MVAWWWLLIVFVITSIGSGMVVFLFADRENKELREQNCRLVRRIMYERVAENLSVLEGGE